MGFETMTKFSPERWQILNPLLDEILDLPAGERAARLASLHDRDPALATDLRSLLTEQHALEQEEFLSKGPGLPVSSTFAGQRLGPYTLVSRLGEGGMGEVWLAEQKEPVARQVAIKLIKHGMNLSQVVTRFEAERQALALMNHPAVAKVFDAGYTPQGQPFFVMEYVRGVSITEHCDSHRLPTRERIELFLQVCAGVQHAHHKAVIHRDLKPTNVLVSDQDGLPVVKIIDFGLAKALAHRLTEQTLYTELGVMMGTPEYMSPEQAALSGQDVDTRSDVYSLGVMLYELLVGALPFDSRELREGSLDELRRRIREVDPPTPSARLATLGDRSSDSALRRGTQPRALRRELSGDLDWITMRALEKDRARRYPSPSELAEDLRRYLDSEPVLARAPSARYRAAKFVRRHRLGVAAAAVMVLSLAAGAIGSTVALVRARRAEARARMEAETKGHVADFLNGLFKVSDPSEARGNTITARELLDKAAGTIDTQLSREPSTQAEMTTIMGGVYASLGLYSRSRELCERALEIRRRVLGPDHPDTLASMMTLSAAYLREGRYADAERMGSQALEIEKRVLGPEHPDTVAAMMNLANIYFREGRFPEAEPLYSATIEIRKRTLGPEHPDTLYCILNLAALYSSQGRYADAERLYSQMIEILKRTLGPEHPMTLRNMSNLAKEYMNQGRFAECERLEFQVLDIQKRILGPEHPDVLYAMTNLALAYQGQGRYPEAERLESETLELQRRVLGPEHPDVLWSMNNLALAYQSQGRYAEAERLHLQTLEIRKRRLGPKNPDTLTSLYNLACVAARRGDRGKAMDWLRQDVDGGDIDFDTMAKDPELQSLHGPEFDALIAKVHQNAAASRAPEGDRPKN
jgi:non-specific serine/threonine protein kinase/serine/threonine-protein kinase